MFKPITDFIQDTFGTRGFIPLHEPRFVGNEKKYLADCIDSTFVSSVGGYVDEFEKKIRDYTGAKYAVATVNGTAALHTSLVLAGVSEGDLVITQALCFIATSNAISYQRALPLYIDVDMETLGLSPAKLAEYLQENAERKTDGFTYHKVDGRRMAACVPMHTFGHPSKIDEISKICAEYNIVLIEDAAESLGSKYKEKQTGLYGLIGAYSFNGNKTITCGGGGVIVTNDETIGKKAKHLTTTAKVPHSWDFVHDAIGYNYRMPNLNAALACAQIENLDLFIRNKRQLAEKYKQFFSSLDVKFVEEPRHSESNYWLNALLFADRAERDAFLVYSNQHKVMTRPAWTLMNRLEMYKDCPAGDLSNSEWIEDRLVNIPSSVII